MRSIHAALALAVALSGCATRRADLSRPIDVERRWYGRAYAQGGEPIPRCRLALALHETAGGREPTRWAGIHATNGALFLGAGVGAAIAASTTSRGTAAALAGASAASLVVSALLFRRADQRVADAVERHNFEARRPLATSAACALDVSPRWPLRQDPPGAVAER
jgi:hypothetical protein